MVSGDHRFLVAVQAVDDDTGGSVLLDGVSVGHYVAVPPGNTRIDACLAESMNGIGHNR